MFIVQRTEDATHWDIIHEASNMSIHPFTGLLSRRLTKAATLHIAKWATKHAQGDTLAEIAQSLADAGYIDLLRDFVDPRKASIPVNQQFPL